MRLTRRGWIVLLVLVALSLMLWANTHLPSEAALYNLSN